MLYKLNFWQGTWRWQYHAYVKCDRIIASVGWKQGFIVALCSRSFSIIGSSLSWARKGQVWMNNIMCDSLVWKLKVIPSHLHRLLQSAVSLNFRPSFLSPQGSQFRVHQLLFHCEVACLSLTVWAACLAWSLSRRFFNFLFHCSAASAACRALSLLFLRHHRSSCSCADLTALLGLLHVSKTADGKTLKKYVGLHRIKYGLYSHNLLCPCVLFNILSALVLGVRNVSD